MPIVLFTQRTVGALVALVLTGCGQGGFHVPEKSSTVQDIAAPSAGGAPVDLIENKEDVVFSLAEFLAGQKGRHDLHAIVSPEDHHLALGDAQKFALQSNVELQSIVNKGFLDRKVGLSGRFWADGFVFGKRLGGSSQGSLLQIGIDAMENSMALFGRIRYLGQDRLAGKLATKVDRLLTRQLTEEATVYGSDLLGIKVSGNIGGEIGIAADLDRRVDDAMVLGFIPRSGLNAGLGGKVELLKFARAEIAGTVGLMNTDLATQGAMGGLKKIGILLGDVSMAGGAFKALDGKVFVGASAGSQNGLLPTGVQPALWQTVDSKVKAALARIMPDIAQWKWVHVLWDPMPINITEFPTYSQPFVNQLHKPKDRDECVRQYDALSLKLNELVANTEKLVLDIDEQYKASGAQDHALVQRMRVLATSKSNYRLIQGKIEDECDAMRP